MAVDAARAKSLFLAASDIAVAEDRAAYLDRECGADAELRARVEALLRANDAAPLPPPEGVTSNSAPNANPETGDYDPTTRVGVVLASKYKLIEEIGEGGMGSVWMAQQTEPVKRAVAVKVVKAGMDSKAVLARFEAERQALAMMDHPNIARVLDVGATGSGRPFFVMELVKGVAITKYCDEHKLTPRQRLELFVPVCQAIQHAHQKGIIHRDIKPSNVLVAMYDDKPVPKVIDFGVAKAAGSTLTERTLMTGFGAVVGTPEYMSPEQASLNNLDIDTRSDVYSLGVLLFELLTGTTPVDRKSLGQAALLEVLRIVREVEAPRPSAKLSTLDALPSVAANRGTEPARLSRLMKGELDWLVLKALEKDRTRRYETANGLARDIQRYLADEVVEARPPSAGYRLNKFVRRNKSQVIAASLILFALLAGIAGTTAGLIRARQAAEREAAERRRAEAAQVEAQAKEAEANAVVNFFQDKVFSAGRPKRDSGGLGHDVLLRDAIKASLPALATSFRDQPLVEARLRWTLGLTFRKLGEYAQSVDQFEQARALFTRYLGSDHPDTLMSMMTLANSYEHFNRHAEALKLHVETLDARKRVLGPDHPDTLRSMFNLANSYEHFNRHAEALQLRRDALAGFRRVLGPEHPDTLKSMFGLASSYDHMSRHAEALKLYEETLAGFRRVHGTDHPDTLACMTNLAAIYNNRFGRHAEGAKLFEETLAAQRRVLPPDHHYTLITMMNLGISYEALNRHADAVKLFEEALPVMKAKMPDDPFTFSCMNSLAASYAALNRHPEALKLHEETLAAKKRVFRPGHPAIGDTIYGIACVHALMIPKADDKSRQTDLAMDWLRQAVAAGYKNAAHMKKDTDLDALREREDFKKLIDSLPKAPDEK